MRQGNVFCVASGVTLFLLKKEKKTSRYVVFVVLRSDF